MGSVSLKGIKKSYGSVDVIKGIDLEVNLVKLVKLGLGAAYRYTSDVTLPGTSKKAMEGFNASLSIKVGVF